MKWNIFQWLPILAGACLLLGCGNSSKIDSPATNSSSPVNLAECKDSLQTAAVLQTNASLSVSQGPQVVAFIQSCQNGRKISEEDVEVSFPTGSCIGFQIDYLETTGNIEAIVKMENSGVCVFETKVHGKKVGGKVTLKLSSLKVLNQKVKKTSCEKSDEGVSIIQLTNVLSIGQDDLAIAEIQSCENGKIFVPHHIDIHTNRYSCNGYEIEYVKQTGSIVASTTQDAFGQCSFKIGINQEIVDEHMTLDLEPDHSKFDNINIRVTSLQPGSRYRMDLIPNDQSVFSRIIEITHSDNYLVQGLTSEAKGRGFGISRTGNFDSISYQIDAGKIELRGLDENASTYKYAKKYIKMLEDVMEFAKSASMESFESIDFDVPPFKAEGPFSYVTLFPTLTKCLMISLAKEIQVPYAVSLLKKPDACTRYGSGEKFFREINKVTFSRSEQDYRGFYKKEGLNQRLFALAEVDSELCSYYDFDREEVLSRVDDYVRAGWVQRPIGSPTVESIRGQCRHFVVNNVYPVIIGRLFEAAVEDRAEENHLTELMFRGMTKVIGGKEERAEFITKKIEKMILENLVVPGFHIFKHFQRTLDLDIQRIKEGLEKFDGKQDDFTSLITIMLLAEQGKEKTPLQQAYEDLSSSSQKVVRGHIARLLQQECNGVLDFFCVKASRKLFAPYTITVQIEGIEDRVYYGFGGLSSKEYPQWPPL